MRVKIGLTVLLLSAFFWAPGIQVAQHANSAARLAALETPPAAPASVTVPLQAPVEVSNAADNAFGLTSAGLTPAPDDLTGDVLAAYTLAVAISPTGCHITTPMLAAIGQVESGNLAGHSLDGHRVSPAILGPVLDGKKYSAVVDTDAGSWDGNTRWDRALGPMQIIPSSWRVVGLDMDGDGIRDPQNIYDSAGAAMVYLCAGGRDLSTAAGLKEAVLSYNRSADYLRAVLAWTSVFEKADLTGMGAVPFVASLAVPTTSTPLDVSSPVPTSDPHATPKPSVTKARPLAPGAATPPSSTSTSPSSSPTTGPTPSSGPSTGPSTNPSTGPSTDPAPSTDPTPPAAEEPDPTPPASEEPTPTPTEEPTKPADPEPLPECPVPTPPAETADQTAAPTDEPVVSPETCTPPEGYEFDPETGELVPEPTPAP